MIPIEERFEVIAPVERVWDYFSNPSQVVPCLPGAELLDVVDAMNYKGQVQIRVGQITAQYQGTVVVEKMDQQNWSMTLVARGDQKGNAGRAEARIDFSLSPLAKGGTQVVVRAEVSIAGRLAQLGSGMIQIVSKQLFRKFVECVQNEMQATYEGD